MSASSSAVAGALAVAVTLLAVLTAVALTPPAFPALPFRASNGTSWVLDVDGSRGVTDVAVTAVLAAAVVVPPPPKLPLPLLPDPEGHSSSGGSVDSSGATDRLDMS